METAEPERFCRHGINYTYDSEDETPNSEEHINFTTNKGDKFERVIRTGRWKKSEYGSDEEGIKSAQIWLTTGCSDGYRSTSWKKWVTVSDTQNLERMYHEYLDFLASKYPDDKDPIYYYHS